MKIKQFIYILFLTTGFLAGLPYAYASPLINGEDLAVSIRNAIPPENILIEASMQVTQKNRKRIQTALTIETKLLGQDEFMTTYKTKPESNLMVWQIRRKVDEQNAYSCKPEENSNIHVGIAGSSFTLADFGLEFLHWPSQKTIKKQRRKSRLCNVLESRPMKSIKEKYSRVLSWVDEKSGAIIAADFFDINGEILKRFTVKGLTKKNGQWQVDELEMRDLNEGSKSRLKLNY